MTESQADALIDRPAGTTPRCRPSDKGNLKATFGLTMITVYVGGGAGASTGAAGSASPARRRSARTPGYDSEQEAWTEAYKAAGWPCGRG
jgi:hypothetical protein